MTPETSREPWSARLHGLAGAWQPLERVMIRGLRRYFERAPGYVLLTTRGRRSGLPREVLLPCARIGDEVVVVSTYGWRSHWLRNLRQNPEVEITCNGAVIRGRAEVVDGLERKRELVTTEPFFLAVPFALLYGILWTVLRPLVAAAMRWWVAARPVVVIRPDRREQ